MLLGQVVAHHVSTRSATAAVAADKAFGEMGKYVHRIDVNKTNLVSVFAFKTKSCSEGLKGKFWRGASSGTLDKAFGEMGTYIL